MTALKIASERVYSWADGEPEGTEGPWCGHAGPYRVTGFLCGRGKNSDQAIRCPECGRNYFNSQVSALIRAGAASPDDLCKHELLRADCAYCRPKKPRQPRASASADTASSAPVARARPYARRRQPWFEARYPGLCAGCDEQIRAGDLIRKDPGYGYIRQGCCGDDDG